MMKTTPLLLSLLAFAACATAVHTLGSSDCVVFLGDSITEQGAAPGGYVSMIRDSLSARYPGIRVIGAGISGNKVPDLQRRLERDVLSKRPTLVVVYIGINDVWHSILPGHSGTPAGEYESGLTDIITKIKDAGARVILCTPSVVGERRNGSNQLDEKLDAYAAISRRVAAATGSTLCDLRKYFFVRLAAANTDDKEKGILTVDGVHLNPDGNAFVAGEILKHLQP